MSLMFQVLSRGQRRSQDVQPRAFLHSDAWDDWGKYETQFNLWILDTKGTEHYIGQVKIGTKGLKPSGRVEPLPANSRQPNLPAIFEALNDPFFSLGQSDDYYENLNQLGSGIRDAVLTGLRDLAASEALWMEVKEEEVVIESLLRSVSETSVTGQFRRITRGGVRRTAYNFSYQPSTRADTGAPPGSLQFAVDPDTEPPSNVHVLIGRNGVGKTYLLSQMTKALVAPEATAKPYGVFLWPDEATSSARFASLVAVSFSAFDSNELLTEEEARKGQVKYTYIGLREPVGSEEFAIKPKTVATLAKEFLESMLLVSKEPRRSRWRSAIQVLMGDPVFSALGLDNILEGDRIRLNQEEVLALFDQLSSGHKIVLLTLTRLVETVEEKTLVLMDEPESHLHPPLLAAFVRALSDLLADRNGVAIIATHSPVVLQEVPSRCVWKINRFGQEQNVERPAVETFGENIGVLTREVFQLELARSGYQKILEQAVRNNASYDLALFHFGDQLGMEARSILRALYAVKESDDQALA